MSRPFVPQGRLKPRPPEERGADSERRVDSGHGANSHQGIGARVRVAGRWGLLLFVRFYQIFLSPFFGGACKFYPSCSKYGYEAIARHGAWRGSVLAMKRLLRCRPFTKGGFDPVPDVAGEGEPQELQGLKPRSVARVDVTAKAVTHKALQERKRHFTSAVDVTALRSSGQAEAATHKDIGAEEASRTAVGTDIESKRGFAL
ncbi:MAG: membrane protein insertion efficiency factor YidD [Candidatus Acidiferrales bacterium]